MRRSANKMSLLTLLLALSLAQLSSSQSQQNSANIPFYSLIFSEKFPPTMGGSSPEAQDIRTNEISYKKKEFLPSVFIPAKNKGLLKIEETEKETPSTFEQVMGIGRNLKMAFFDFADVTLIRSVVDLSFDGLSPQERLKVNKIK